MNKNLINSQRNSWLWSFLLFFFLIFSQGFSQEARNVTGQVTAAADGTPLPGVNILVKGTNNGTMTDFDGNYSIMASSDAVLVFSFIGLKSIEVETNGRSTINVSMEDDFNALDEVVIVGYGTVKKSDLTGSVTGIKSEDIVKARSTSFLEAMQGRMAGVQVKQQSGEPGAGVDIRIRGTNSVNASSNPLYVIDGVQIDINEGEVANSTIGNTTSMNPLATLNPNDIKSIEVLKDASATAIYGSRGANGVVIVTTKDGSNGRVTFSYNTYGGFANASKKLDVLSGDDYINYRRENDINNNDRLFWEDTNGDGTVDTPRDVSSIPRRNWQDEALRSAFVQSHYISASGGNSKTNFSASLGYLDQEGIVINNDYKRLNTRIKIDHKFSDKFNVGFNLTTAYSEQSGTTSSGGGINFNGALQSLIISKPIEFFNPDNPEDAQFGRYLSPLTQIVNAEKKISLSQTIANVFLEYKFTNDLVFKINGGGNISSSKGKEFYGNDTPFGIRDNGRAVLQNSKVLSYFTTSQLNYHFNINDTHDFNIMAAAELNYYDNERFKVDVTDFPDQSTGADDIFKAGNPRELSSNRFSTNRISYIGRLNYNLMDKYLFTASVRRDGSDKFGPGNKWGTFPSGAFAWKVSEENFLKDSRALSTLKLRLGYGVTGNERIPPYSYFSRLGNTFISTNGGLELGLAPSARGNPNLKWETTAQYNAGLDIGLVDDRVNLTFDVYKKETKDMLLLTPVASQSGYLQEFQNIGQVDNTGAELGINTFNVSTPNFSWNTNINIAYNKNEVKSLGSAGFIPVTVFGGYITNVGRVQEGAAIGSIYGYEWDGIYQIDDFTWQNNSDPTIPFNQRVFVLKDGVVVNQSAAVFPGALRFKDISGPDGVPDGVVDAENDRKVLGNSFPDLFGGVSNSFRFGNFTFDFFLEWQYGNEIFNEAKFRLEGWDRNNITQDYYENRWTPDNPTNTHGSPSGGNPTARLASSYYVEDGSYIRLANATLGYNVPDEILDKIGGLQSLRIYTTGTNLKTWTNYSGFDPDISFNNPLIPGFDRTSYPRARTLIFGLNMTF